MLGLPSLLGREFLNVAICHTGHASFAVIGGERCRRPPTASLEIVQLDAADTRASTDPDPELKLASFSEHNLSNGRLDHAEAKVMSRPGFVIGGHSLILRGSRGGAVTGHWQLDNAKGP